MITGTISSCQGYVLPHTAELVRYGGTLAGGV